MRHGLTHASFFSGAGGVDLGLERAGWRTVSFSEIDPYACAVLAERWPGVPNLGSIVDVAAREGRGSDGRTLADGVEPARLVGRGEPWHGADLWTGGFPCQDLSIAGKRRGLAGERSGLAFAYLGLVERHRPPAVLLENVPGLLSSNAGRDLGALLGTLGELGYGWAYRVLDARHFGVPQRRRRVFILGIHARIDPSGQRAAEVLSVGSRCGGHPPAGIEAGPGTSDRADDGADVVGALSTSESKNQQEVYAGHILPADPPHDARGEAGWRQGSAAVRGPVADPGHGERADPVRRPLGAAPDAARDGAPDGLAGRAHDRDIVVNALDTKRGGPDDNEAQAGHLIVANSLQASAGHHGHSSPRGDGSDNLVTSVPIYDTDGSVDFLLPLGLDSHRYRCCGNGVVSDVAEWIGARLAEELA